jgi:phenylalanyl-tRNA synthetase beta chain
LPGSFKIKKAKLRGVASFGMLCSEKELQLSDDSEGIMELESHAIIGEALIEYLGLKDTQIEIDLTPNRGDCLSIKGIAREVSALTGASIKAIEIPKQPIHHHDVLPIKVMEPKANPLFITRIIQNVNIHAKTPDWMKHRLLASNIRSIAPIVDVTNYVMIELGHPLHAFDREKIADHLEVRYAKKNESLSLLNAQKVILRENTLVVADSKQALSIAGIMGGMSSAISETTQHIVLESAYWNPIEIAGKARTYALHTDASHRFERGVDYNVTLQAIERATELLLHIVGGKVGPIHQEMNKEHLPSPKSIYLRRIQVSRLLGIEMSDEMIEQILHRLGMSTISNEDGWHISVPSSRFDIILEVDIIEELIRIYGYDKIPTRQPFHPLKMIRTPEKKLTPFSIAKLLAARGYQEIMTYSFLSLQQQSEMDSAIKPLTLMNPISSELAVMRTSLWPNILNVVAYNQKRQQNVIKIFELGLKFIPDNDELLQTSVLAGAICGKREDESWESRSSLVDFYDLKGDLEALLKQTDYRADFTFVAEKREGLHPKQSARIFHNGVPCGYIGKCHPTIQKKWDIDTSIFLFELELQSISKRRIPYFKPLSKYPSIRRDLAFLVKEEITSSQIIDLIQLTIKKILKEIIIFDIYQGKGIKEGYKSMAIGLILQRDDRTFKDSEITKIMNRVILKMNEQLAIVLRD